MLASRMRQEREMSGKIKLTPTSLGMRLPPIKRGGFIWIDRGGDWVIRQGVSKFLIAQGPGYSRKIGRDLFTRLTSPAHD